MTQSNIIQTILKDSKYHLTLFEKNEIEALQGRISVKTTKGKEALFVKCIVRNKKVQLKPEEIVLQLYAARLIKGYGYPRNRLAFGYSVNFGGEKKSADIVILDKDKSDTPFVIIELKRSKLRDEKEQLKSYCNATGALLGVLTNGEQIIHYHRKDPNYFADITNIPNVRQTLEDILIERKSARRLARLGGTEPQLQTINRRQSKPV